MRKLDVLIPTYGRPAALAVTLCSLACQIFNDFWVVISDQTSDRDIFAINEVMAVMRLLRFHGQDVETYRHLPRRGMAEQRQFLLDRANARYVLYIDDDVILERFVIRQLLDVIQAENCGFVGSALIGLSYLDDIRPEEQKVEFWEGTVQPEIVKPGMPGWKRWRLHNAANVHHLQQRLGLTPDKPRRYRVAWVGGCVLYDMARLGGCGVLPSGVYHQELSTTITDRRIDAPREMDI